MPEPSEFESTSLIGLIRKVTELVPHLVRDEIQTLRLEVTGKLKAAGLGVGLFAGAAFIAFLLVGVLVVAAVTGLATVVAAWLAALIVGAVLLLVTGGLVLLGIRQFKTAAPLKPVETVRSVQADIRVVKGIA